MIEFLKQGISYGLIGVGAALTFAVFVLVAWFVLAVVIDVVNAISKHGKGE